MSPPPCIGALLLALDVLAFSRRIFRRCSASGVRVAADGRRGPPRAGDPLRATAARGPGRGARRALALGAGLGALAVYTAGSCIPVRRGAAPRTEQLPRAEFDA